MRLVSLSRFLMFGVAVVMYVHHSSPVHSLQTSTFSIVAVDPETGDVGVAVASCIELYVDVVAALVPGKGAAATQAALNLKNRNTVFELLQEGYSAEEIIQHVTDPSYDNVVEERQYGIVTFHHGTVEIAAFTGGGPLRLWGGWAGAQHDMSMGVAVQGNSLVSEAVVAEAMHAFKEPDDEGHNALSDRLMRALEAGSAAGGDMRCNNDEVTQTAASACILVARGTDPPYATRAPGITDMDTPEAPWLALSVLEPQFGPNPIVELRERYDMWRQHTVFVETGLTALPTGYLLSQNYPNPFNPNTTIAYDLPQASNVTLTIYTITGQKVAVLADTHQDAGHHMVIFDGSGYANGVYLYRLEVGSFVETKRMVLLQ